MADLRRCVRTTPELKLVITETPGDWFPTKATELDALHAFYASKREEPLNKAFLQQVPRRPSEYMAKNVYFGASFTPRYEVEQAVLEFVLTKAVAIA